MRTNDKGFTLVEILLVVIALTLIVSAGFYIANSNKTSDTPSPKKVVTQATNNTKDSQKYLDIRELGVKIPLSKELADISYFEAGENIVVFKSNNLQNLYMSAGCIDEGEPSGGSIVSVSKKSGTFQSENDAELFKQFDDFNLSGWSTIIACQDPEDPSTNLNSAYTQHADVLHEEIVQALKNAKEL